MIKWFKRLLSPKSKNKRTVTIDGVLLSIEEERDVDRPYNRAFGDYTDHDLWDMGWHDAQWHSKPNSRFVDSVPYMRGWNEARK